MRLVLRDPISISQASRRLIPKSKALLRELFEQVFINFVAHRADGAGLFGTSATHTATRFVQMRAVVELTVAAMRLDIGHELAQIHGRDVVQAKLLKSG